MRPLLTFLASLLFSAPLSAQQVVSPGGWQSYRNERFGLSLSYPGEVFQLERTSEAGDGVVFRARGTDARMLVGALPNRDRHTVATYQNLVARKSYAAYQIHYRPRGNTWFVLSGEGDGRIFYEKIVFSCGGRLINSFALIYPAADRQTFDPIVERVEDTFRAGTAACDQGADLTPRKRLAHTKTAPRVMDRRTTRRLPRAAFADRIARSRGTDVLVVLRRAGPPYDYKVVRGYAAR
jgi:mannose-6-phosphate isomerase-like protein (cupin superfamily)